MLRIIFSSFLFLSLLNSSFSQICGNHNHTENFDKLDEIEKQIRNTLYNKPITNSNRLAKPNIIEPQTITLPIMFHVFHQNGYENLTDERILFELARLNDVFRARGDYSSSNDMKIEFCLANKLIDGSPTSGIDRVETSATLWDERQNKTNFQIAQQPDDYVINIYIVRSIYNPPGSMDIGGFAYFPWLDQTRAIVIEYLSFDASTTLPHEMGHYLGLYHSFDGQCKNDDCTKDGDKVCDTPPDNNRLGACELNSCFSDTADLSENNPFRPIRLGGLGDQKDMTNNFMDYTWCTRNLFTIGQRNRMHAVINTLSPSLLLSNACSATCDRPITADFSMPSTDEVGQTFIYNATSNADSLVWMIEDTIVGRGNQLSTKFSHTGSYDVELYAFNTEKTCYKRVVKEELVFCPRGGAPFTIVVKEPILLGESFLAHPSSGSSKSKKWKIDNTIEMPIDTLFFGFNTVGTHIIEYTQDYNNWGCIYSVSKTINVQCNTKAQISGLPNTIWAGEAYELKSESTNSNQVKWFLNDLEVSTANTYSWVANLDEKLMMVSYSAFCSDTFKITQAVKTASACNANPHQEWIIGAGNIVDWSNLSKTQEVTSASENNYTALCDENGKLKIYSDGNYVYDSKHAQLKQISLQANYRSEEVSQEVIILPHPVNKNIVYLFETGPAITEAGIGPMLNHYYGSLRCTELDISTGVWLEKKTYYLAINVSEKMVAVKNETGDGYWLLIQTSGQPSQIKAYKIDANGFNNIPVTSNLTVNCTHKFQAEGQMTASADGKKIAITANEGYFNTADPISGMPLTHYLNAAYVAAYNFNNQTGSVSTPIFVKQVTSGNFYGSSFSPSGRYLYASQMNNRIRKYDLESSSFNEQEIQLDGVTNKFYSMQLNPLGEIVVANTSLNLKKFAIISNPDEVNSTLSLSTYSTEKNLTKGLCITPPILSPKKLQVNMTCIGNTFEPIVENASDKNFYWSYNGQYIYENTPSINYVKNEDTLKVYNSSYLGCVEEKKGVTCIISSIYESETNNSINIKPNPSSGNFEIKIAKEANITLINMQGTVVFEKIINENYTFGQNLESGTYLLTVIQKDKVQTIRIIKL